MQSRSPTTKHPRVRCGASRNAAAMISGPIPAGSPSVSAKGRETDIGVSKLFGVLGREVCRSYGTGVLGDAPTRVHPHRHGDERLCIMARQVKGCLMSALELMIWSMAAGVIAAVVVVGLVDLAVVRSAGAAQGVVYHFTALLFVILLSGIPRAIHPQVSVRALHVAQVLIGPLCSSLGNYWIRGWLAAHQRDRIMAWSLGLSAVATPIAGLLCFALPYSQQLPAAALL